MIVLIKEKRLNRIPALLQLEIPSFTDIVQTFVQYLAALYS